MASNKLSASETQLNNIEACRALLERLTIAVDAHAEVSNPNFADCGSSRDIAQQLAQLVRSAEGVDHGDDYGVQLLKDLGL